MIAMSASEAFDDKALAVKRLQVAAVFNPHARPAVALPVGIIGLDAAAGGDVAGIWFRHVSLVMP